MKISVIVCTHNRSAVLSNALESIAVQRMPESAEWEVVVVDNNSTDATRSIVESFCQKYPNRFRYVFQPLQGLSHARNAGLGAAYGAIIAFTDDDVVAEPDWLQNLTAMLHDPGWAGAGGRVLGASAIEAPAWLALDGPYCMLGVLYGHFDLGDDAQELNRAPHGANMAFRSSMFQKHGGFRLDLGISPGNRLNNEDTEFGRRLKAAGEHLWYAPSAVVYHEIPRLRINRQYFQTWWYGYGRAQIREAGNRPNVWGIAHPVLSIPHIALRHLPIRALRWLFAMDSQRRFYRKCMLSVALGWLVETCRMVHGKGKGQEIGLDLDARPAQAAKSRPPKSEQVTVDRP
jgi:glycosyltransferase involved in cell wall biosynthesis